MKNGSPPLFCTPFPGRGEGGTSAWTCRSLVLALAQERGPRALPPTFQNQGHKISAQGAAAMGGTLKSRRHEGEAGFLIEAEQGTQRGRP